jgi:hypothetical protein
VTPTVESEDDGVGAVGRDRRSPGACPGRPEVSSPNVSFIVLCTASMPITKLNMFDPLCNRFLKRFKETVPEPIHAGQVKLMP